MSCPLNSRNSNGSQYTEQTLDQTTYKIFYATLPVSSHNLSQLCDSFTGRVQLNIPDLIDVQHTRFIGVLPTRVNRVEESLLNGQIPWSERDSYGVISRTRISHIDLVGGDMLFGSYA